MASFSAELRVAGQVIPLLHCRYDTFQSTDGRGRVNAKVRRHPVEAEADVPHHQLLEAWAADPHKHQEVFIIFFNDDTGTTWETLHLPAAYCVDYHEQFVTGDSTSGSYRCRFTLSDPDGWTLHAGGPLNPAAIRPAAGEHGSPAAVGVVPLVGQTKAAAQSAFRKNLADPIRDILGPGRTSHPEEWSNTLASLKQEGVEIMLTAEERLAYAPGTRPGSPGQIHLHEDASIGALRHEYQHFLDDKAAGYLGTRGLYDLVFRRQTEQNAYNLEIKMMEEAGEKKAADQLRQNLSDELSRLERDLGDIEVL